VANPRGEPQSFRHCRRRQSEPPAIHEAELLIKSVKRNLYKVTAPVLVIHAIEDDISTLRSADFVVNHIGSDHVRKIMLHDSYHLITMDNERELVADETIKFF